MKSYTSVEQSRKLTEILPIESADMGWNVFADNSVRCLPINDWDLNKDESNGVKFIPAWSLAALLDQLEDTIYDDDGNAYELVIKKESVQYDLYYLDVYGEQENIELDRFYDDLIDCCYEMILKLKEKDLI